MGSDDVQDWSSTVSNGSRLQSAGRPHSPLPRSIPAFVATSQNVPSPAGPLERDPGELKSLFRPLGISPFNAPNQLLTQQKPRGAETLKTRRPTNSHPMARISLVIPLFS
ncbi:hypothetical protein CISG_04109 [Coccidioides immitis RMSCC 3703]|uniref:Uncharacterized protein n=2 Tax=Coccidioides immitis TaxID=5501 RepID=A0A0J8QRP1_COCIT|nr:hypothetical protein CIRG_06633 [Coccidioides immitis RMSCC 2394]KMU75161.1 hypothetical protein CISG_04109 [Coccidioides immitis RMSCC 3703]